MPDKNEKILLLSCPPEYREQLGSEGYNVSSGFVFEYNQDVYKNFPDEYNQCLDSGVDYAAPGPVYEYKLLVYSPFRSLFKWSARGGMARVRNEWVDVPKEPLPDYFSAIDKAGTICVVFRNKYLKWSDSHCEQVPKSLSGRVPQRPPSDNIYYEFGADFHNGKGGDATSLVSDNDAAKVLGPAIESFISEGNYPWTAMKGLKQNDSCCPILTNALGDPHAVWIRQGKGGILFLPEFMDNLAVLKVLLELPLSKLLEPEPIDSDSLPEQHTGTPKPEEITRPITLDFTKVNKSKGLAVLVALVNSCGGKIQADADQSTVVSFRKTLRHHFKADGDYVAKRLKWDKKNHQPRLNMNKGELILKGISEK